MTDFVDYYEILEISETADNDEIEEALKTQRQRWRKRQSSPDLVARHQAEKRMAQIADARATLLNASSRREYDERRQAHRAQSYQASDGAADQQATGVSDWAARARDAIAAFDYSTANFAAREALQFQGGNDEMWYIRANSAMGLNDWREAEFSFNEAIRLNQTKPEYHFDLGCAYEALDDDEAALRKFRDAHSVDRKNPLYEVASAESHLRLHLKGRDASHVTEAIQIMERVVETQADNGYFNTIYAWALANNAFTYATVVDDGESFILTSDAQVERARKDTQTARRLSNIDPEAGAMVSGLEAFIERAESMVWRHPEGFMRGVWIVGALALLGLGSAIHGIVGIIFLVGIIYGYVKVNRMPRWQRSYKNIRAGLVSGAKLGI